MKTERTSVKTALAIWAVPSECVDEGELPFRYVVKAEGITPWQDGSVKVFECEQTLFVPAGIDLLQAAIETLKGEIQKTRAEAQKKVENYEKQMDGLLLLSHMPSKTPIVDDMTGMVDYD